MSGPSALWLPAKGAAFSLGDAPTTKPGPGMLAVRNHAIAVNPVDRMLPVIGDLITPWLRYPAILGSDVAGEVVAVGAGVTRFRVGDRVLGHAVGIEKDRNDPAEGAFQAVSLLLEHMASPIPDGLAFEQAAVLPLGLSTAACGLFQPDFLALRPPQADPPAQGESLVVWGGSTSVGANAIQLAVAAGYEVATTASPRNFDYVLGLGAARAFDYRSRTAVRDIVASLGGRPLAGVLAIGAGSIRAAIDIAGASRGRRFVAVATPPAAFDKVKAGPGRIFGLVPAVFGMLTANVALALRARAAGVETKMIWGGSLLGNAVGPMIYADFLPSALAEGRFRAAPPALVVGQGLGALPAALDRLGQGVSAQKVVVTLPPSD